LPKFAKNAKIAKNSKIFVTIIFNPRSQSYHRELHTTQLPISITLF
jgi:hypothetical protein